jgi:peptidoglycan/LPS O-acetylase OafA/YrhL
MAAVPRKSEEVAMAKSITIEDRMQSAGGAMTGFDFLRIALSVAVLCWHSIRNSTGSIELDHALWSGSYRFLPAAIIPTFFALSGFLVAGSLDRTRLVPFMTLRFLRLVPALAVEITLSALILGLIFTTLPRSQYLTHEQFYSYFLNIVGSVQYRLPGVFETNPDGGTVNAQLWTIPFELECYFALVLLSLSTLVRRRLAFISVAFGLSLALTVWTLLGHPADPTTHIPGRALVLSFLAAVSLYLYRGVIPYSNVVGVLSAIAAAALLEIPDAASGSVSCRIYDRVDRPDASANDTIRRFVVRHLSVSLPDRANGHAYVPGRPDMVDAHTRDIAFRDDLRMAILESDRKADTHAQEGDRCDRRPSMDRDADA